MSADDRFDELGKTLAASTSRRKFLKVAAAAAAAGVLSAVRAPSAAAKHNRPCRDFGANCSSNAECCTGACIDFHCACPSGTVICEKTGHCVPTCVPPKVFSPTTCTCVCPPNTTECGNTCCAAGQTCSNGTCAATVVCETGQTPCVSSSGVTVKCCPASNPVCCPSGGSFSCKKSC